MFELIPIRLAVNVFFLLCNVYHEFYAKFVGVSILCQIIKRLFPGCPHDFNYESSYQIVRVYSLLFSQFIFFF